MITVTYKASPRSRFLELFVACLLLVSAGCSTAFRMSSPAKNSQDVGRRTEGSLNALAVVSATDIWAVGLVGFHALIEHWNGSTWRLVPSPDPGTGNQAALYGIAAVSAHDIWAVGRYSLGTTPTFRTLIEHWNGASWSIVTSPNVQEYQQNILVGVVAISARNIWAVGQGFVQQSDRVFGYRTLIEHWDGSRWKILAHSQEDGGLSGIGASSDATLWTVGSRGYPQRYRTLLKRWDGRAWRTVLSADVSRDNILQGIAVTSANNAWAVGLSSLNFPQAVRPLVEQWDGHRWKAVDSAPLNAVGELDGVTASSSNDAWAVGFSLTLQSHLSQTLIEHWDGAHWKLVPSPNVGGIQNANQLNAIAASSPKDLWAVGRFFDSASCDQNPMCSPSTLIEHWDGHRWNLIQPAQ